MKKCLVRLSLLLPLLAIPALSAATLSVKDLGALIAGMQQQSKPDGKIAEKLAGVQLSEQLTPAAIEQLRAMNLGPEALEQIHILAIESAMLPPPAADLPATAAPDVAAQKAILARTVSALAGMLHEPNIPANKTTARFQNGPDSVWSSNGGGDLIAQGDLGQQFAPDNPYFRALGQHTAAIEVMGGVELRPQQKIRAGDPSTQNGQISQGGPGPQLGVAFVDAARGQMRFARWENVGGKPAAVFSFEVAKTESHYEVNYCCFPKTENTGSHLGGPNTYSTNTTFGPFHSAVGYHGEFFIDPASGAIVRFIMQAEMKKSDFVQQEDTRIDYGAVTVDGMPMLLPEQSYVLTTVIPAGDSFQRVAPRRTLLDIHYADYGTAGK